MEISNTDLFYKSLQQNWKSRNNLVLKSSKNPISLAQEFCIMISVHTHKRFVTIYRRCKFRTLPPRGILIIGFNLYSTLSSVSTLLANACCTKGSLHPTIGSYSFSRQPSNCRGIFLPRSKQDIQNTVAKYVNFNNAECNSARGLAVFVLRKTVTLCSRMLTWEIHIFKNSRFAQKSSF